MDELKFGYLNFIYEVLSSFFLWGYCFVLILISLVSLISLIISVLEVMEDKSKSYIESIKALFVVFFSLIFCVSFVLGIFCSAFYVLQNYELDASEYNVMEKYIIEIRQSEKLDESDKILLNNGISKILEDGKIKSIEVVLFSWKYNTLLESNSKQKGISKLKIENKIGETK